MKKIEGTGRCKQCGKEADMVTYLQDGQAKAVQCGRCGNMDAIKIMEDPDGTTSQSGSRHVRLNIRNARRHTGGRHAAVLSSRHDTGNVWSDEEERGD